MEFTTFEYRLHLLKYYKQFVKFTAYEMRERPKANYSYTPNKNHMSLGRVFL